MKFRLNMLALFFVTLYVADARAQKCDSSFLGTKTLYREPTGLAVKVPKGYQPVFINYVGRHGARHLTKTPQSAYLYKLIAKADSAGALTAAGQRLKKMVLALEKVEKGNTKFISLEGAEELKGIANRLYKNNRSVFAGSPEIIVTVTKEIRTRQSADAFLKELRPLINNVTVTENGINDTTLRFYDLSPAYLNYEEKGTWIPQAAAFGQSLNIREVYQKIAERFFNAGFFKLVSSENRREFVNDLFGFATIVYSLKQEITQTGYTPGDLDFKGFFTCEELTALSKTDAAEDFYKKGPGLSDKGIQVKISAPLLADFISTTDGYIADKKISARLRFSHAETISPFAALLDLSTANKSLTNAALIDKNWQVATVIPLSANIQWILYRNKAGDYLLRCLLNEKDTPVSGLKPVFPGFYRWADVKIYYLSTLKSIGADAKGNMLQYLKIVQ